MTSPKTVTPDQPQAVPCPICYGKTEPTEPGEVIIYTEDNCPSCGRNSALAARPVLPVETPAEGLRELKWTYMPSYGKVSFEQLREAVSEANIGNRHHLGPFDPTYYPGHQQIGGCNYNSLNRIVTAFVEAALASTTPAPLSGRNGSLREEVARLTLERDEAIGRAERQWAGWIKEEVARKAAERERDEARAALAAVPPETAEMEGAARDVLAERERQKTVEGYDAAHDDKLSSWQLPGAAALYAVSHTLEPDSPAPEYLWPWSFDLFKPKDARSNLVKAGALILAEIDRLDRLAARASSSGEAGDE